jgi:hypothetical protein
MAPPVDSATHCERDDATENCGIEITPEMIEAGATELASYSHGWESLEDGAERIFRAMVRVRPSKYGRIGI